MPHGVGGNAAHRAPLAILQLMCRLFSLLILMRWEEDGISCCNLKRPRSLCKEGYRTPNRRGRSLRRSYVAPQS